MSFGSRMSAYNSFQHVDFIEKQCLLLLIHIAFTEHFYSALGARLSMHALSHLTEGTRTQHLANTIKVTQSTLLPHNEVRG